MPRLSLTPSPRPLVEQIIQLESLIKQCRRDALLYAKEIGDLLRTVPERARAAVANEAGLSRSSWHEYVQISERWSAVADCESLSEARKIIRRPRGSGPFLWSDWLEVVGALYDERQGWRTAFEEWLAQPRERRAEFDDWLKDRAESLMVSTRAKVDYKPNDDH